MAIPNKAKMELFFSYALLHITILSAFCLLFHCFFSGQVQTSALKDHAVKKCNYYSLFCVSKKILKVIYKFLTKGTYTVRQMTREALISIIRMACQIFIYLFDIYSFYSNR